MNYSFYDVLGMFIDMIVEHRLSLIFIATAIIIEGIARMIRKKVKENVYSEYTSSTDIEDTEYYLQYYRKIQLVDLVRVISLIFLIILLFITNTGLDLGFFAVATGAIIITFKDLLISVIAFFFVIPQYSIGLTIRVAGVQGQIIFIRMLSVGIMGKDENGENTGELFVVPNYKFLTEIIAKEDLRSESIMKDSFDIYYHHGDFTIGFEDFLKELRKFLQSTLPVNNMKNVGNYQSYVGHKYKLDFHAPNEKSICIRFIGKTKENALYKEKIIGFIDQYQK